MIHEDAAGADARIWKRREFWFRGLSLGIAAAAGAGACRCRSRSRSLVFLRPLSPKGEQLRDLQQAHGFPG